MKKNILSLLTLVFFLIQGGQPVAAHWVWSPEAGKFINPEGAVQDSADEQYEFAMQFYKEKNLDAALKQLENLIKKYPAASVAAEAQYRRATIYEEKGDYWKAFEIYKLITESYPQSERIDEITEREFRIGNLFLSGKKAKLMGLEILPSAPRAAQVFQHIVDSAPYGAYGDKAQYRLGLTYKKSGQFSKAVEAFQFLIEQYPQSDFVSEARFQIAETSFMRSASAFRDQRALDDASTQVDRYLTRHPDTAASEKAAKLRQQIDEKNAEKNYRVGLYYEKQNYLESSLIYYGDVAKRYPHTVWGQKAAERVQALKAPASFLKGQETELNQEIQKVKTQLESVDKGDEVQKGALKRQLERLELRSKSLEQNKKDTLKARGEDIKRREKDLKNKYKRLEEKRKLLKDNPSQDLRRALDRWASSLEAEKLKIQEEKGQLDAWHQDLGIKIPNFSLGFLPFIGDSVSEVEKVRRIEAKKYFKISGEKKNLLEEKELLYKQHQEVLVQLKQTQGEFAGWQEGGQDVQALLAQGKEALDKRRGELKSSKREIAQLERELANLKSQYVERFGESRWESIVKFPVRLPGKVVRGSTGAVASTLSFLNPFDGNKEDLEKKTPEELAERRMHLRERLAAQQGMVDTLGQAFNEELAMQEQRAMMKKLQSGEKTDVRKLRKEVKGVEKKIRRGYEEINERHDRKKALLNELDGLFKQEQERGAVGNAARTIASPAVGLFKASKALLFGAKHPDVELAESAANLSGNVGNSARAQHLKQEVELESILIEAKYEEIIKLQKQLEILKAKSSLEGGLKFRSVFVDMPYNFVREALESAGQLVPKKNREEKIIHLLDKETKDLESLKSELVYVEELLEQKSVGQAKPATQVKRDPAAPLTRQPGALTRQPKPVDEEKLKSRINSVRRQIEIKKESVTKQERMVETASEMTKTELRSQKSQQKQIKKVTKELKGQNKTLSKELKHVNKEINKLIERERKLDEQEFSILEKRIKKIDQFMNKIHSKALSEDLLVERGRIETRLSEIELRRDFLAKEQQRFHGGEVQLPTV